ncbi:MAG: hypothetical protein EOO77_24915 [Oxalobacteraceae bacterium]|nr:MAG: hypothetical protein EOO77_24915 [Oxalobacteraceae bacterium]
MIELTPAEIRAHDSSGIVAIQVRAEDTSTAVFEVPLSYFKAVAEVAQINIDPPAPVAAPAAPQAPAAAKPPVRRSPVPAKRRK